jgi:hypothetical protein
MEQESRTLEMNNVQDGTWHGRGDTICVGSYSEGNKVFLELHPPPAVTTSSPDVCSMQKNTNVSDQPSTWDVWAWDLDLWINVLWASTWFISWRKGWYASNITQSCLQEESEGSAEHLLPILRLLRFQIREDNLFLSIWWRRCLQSMQTTEMNIVRLLVRPLFFACFV